MVSLSYNKDERLMPGYWGCNRCDSMIDVVILYNGEEVDSLPDPDPMTEDIYDIELRTEIVCESCLYGE